MKSKLPMTLYNMTESRVTWGLPGCPQVHEQVTVIDPRHPDQLLILCHGLTFRRGKGQELWQLGLIWQRAEGTDSCGHNTNSTSDELLNINFQIHLISTCIQPTEGCEQSQMIKRPHLNQ